LAPEDGTIYLLHSADTGEVADRLARRLARVRPTATVIHREIDESDGDKIIAKIEEILREIKPAREHIGLNYSGGTKPMAVHAHYALRCAFPNGCFSYLDPRKLAMVIDPGDKPVQTVPVGRKVELTIEDLLLMHGYRWDAKPSRNPLLPDLCRAIAEVHTTSAGVGQWYKWLGGDWKESPPPLPPPSEYSTLKPVVDALSKIGGGTLTWTPVAQALGGKSISAYQEFFQGKWLEHHTLAAINVLAPAMSLASWGANLPLRKPRRRDFELDLFVVVGYQLFAISCQATEHKDRAKQHLFEVFVRARQIGGDEAHFGLVCCVEKPKQLEQEVSEDWDAEGKIKVFGQDDLLSLPQQLRTWFEKANP
jgi:hypothetical protein